MILNSITDVLSLHVNIALTSMPGDPIHPGHISCLQNLKTAVDRHYALTGNRVESYVTVCLVNDDNFLINKKGFAFMPLADRLDIIDNIKDGADYVVPFSPSDPDDMTVCEAIGIIHPKFFLKGGDRTADKSLPEWEICQMNKCVILDHVGADKIWSSSDYLRKYAEYVTSRVY